MSTVPRTKEQPIRYMMLFIAIMELQKAFTCRATRRPNIRVKLPMKAKPLDIELKGHGNDVKVVTLTYQQRRV
jgi:hypothetical protein